MTEEEEEEEEEENKEEELVTTKASLRAALPLPFSITGKNIMKNKDIKKKMRAFGALFCLKQVWTKLKIQGDKVLRDQVVTQILSI